MDTKRHSTATFDTLRNFNRICLDKSIGSEAVDINKLMPLSLVSYLQSRPPGLWIIPSSASQLGLGVYLSRPPGLWIIPSSASQLGLEFYQSRLSEAVDNVLFFENCYPDISVLPYN